MISIFFSVIKLLNSMDTYKEKLPKMVPVQTSNHKRRTLQRSDSTRVWPSNVGRYKGRTVQTSDLQTSNWYKRRTAGTHVGLRQTSNQYKHWTITNTGPVQTSDGTFLRKMSDFGWVGKNTIAIRNKLKIIHLLCWKNWIKSHLISYRV